MNIGIALRDIRINLTGRRQGEVAEAVGLSQTYLSQIESGQRNPTTEVIEILCKEYKVPMAVVVWKGMEPSDVDKSKQRSFALIRPIIDDLLAGWLANNYK